MLPHSVSGVQVLHDGTLKVAVVIELIQNVKTTLVNLIKMGNRFSY